ncbi:DUF742 domain-containing protein [Dactylosporangium sp. NPDC005572]|uniref:DUF742 domain-containing protein n=1 Tax=Dactylosporangium sp. NPDC005572 TaxID=3156889 RepID=UPI0033A2A315
MASNFEGGHEVWADADAGPVVRPYAMTRGRTQPIGHDFDLISLVTSIGSIVSADVGLGPEHEAIVKLCWRANSVAEISAHLELPVGVVRVMLGDLLNRGLIVVHDPVSATEPTPDDIYDAVIDAIHKL